jgi:hypothetical protein
MSAGPRSDFMGAPEIRPTTSTHQDATMNRFALLPLAFFANACADTEGLEESLADAETEVRELIESSDFDAEKSAMSDHGARMKVLQTALAKFEKDAHRQGCEPTGVAVGNWVDRSFEYKGLFMDMKARPFAAIAGDISYVNNNDGEFNGFSVKSADDVGKLVIEGDWRDGSVQADVLGSNDQPNQPGLSMIGMIQPNDRYGGGYFLTLLADCS